MQLAHTPAVALVPRRREQDIGRKALAVVTAGLCLMPWAGPPVALALGATLALTLGNPFGRAGHRLARVLLQACVVLLGFGTDLPLVLRAGAGGAALAAGTIALTLTLGYACGRLLRVRPGASLLIGCGTAVCGGSAIAAVGSATDADEGDMTVAMGVVYVLNGVALYLLPPLGHALGLTPRQFGTWAGVAIHDVSSVVGAAARFGPDALQTATAVKLSRGLWIVPMTLAFAVALGRRPAVGNATFGFDAGAQKTAGVQVPWFVGLFLLAGVCRSVVPGVANVTPVLGQIATAGLTLTLFLVGTGLNAATLRAVGWRAMTQGVVLWVVVASVSLWAVLHGMG